MNNKYSLGLTVAMLLLLISGSGTLPAFSFSSSFSIPADNATTGDIVVSDQNGSPQSTSSPDKRLSGTDRLNAFSPDSDNTEDAPIASDVVLGSGDGSSESSGISSVSDGSDSDNNLDTVSTSSLEDVSSSDANSVIPSSAETGLNSSSSSSGGSSSGNGVSAPVDVAGDIGESSGSSTNDSSTENNQSPDQGASGVTQSDGTTGSLPSNSTDVEIGGSTNPTGESAVNQSSIDSSLSANQSGVTNTNTMINGSSTGLSTGQAASNETNGVDSGPSANDIQVQPSSEDSEISVASASDPNAVEQVISAGNGQHVNFGDISNQDNVTAIDISLDKNSYNLEDSPKVTIADGEANVDPNALNTIQIVVSSSSDSTGIVLTLTETGPNTGIFQGIFSFTSADSSPTDGTIKISTGDELAISYVGTHPRLSAEIGGVQQGGTVSLTQVARPLVDSPPLLLGASVELTYGPEVQLTPNSVEGCPEGLCEGTTTLEMSYANIAFCHEGTCQLPESLTIFQYLGPEIQWVDLRDFQPAGTSIDVDTDGQTVSAFSPFKGGIFSLGVSIGGGGGGGGGIGFPGAGIVLDLIAPVTSIPPPSPPPSDPPPATEQPPVIAPALADTEDDETSATDQVTDPSLIATNSTTSTTGGQSTDAATASIAGAGATSTNKAQRSGSDTIFIPGEGNITISFENLVSGENLMASALKDPSDLVSLNITKGTNQTGKLTALDNTPYDVVGTVFVIGPYDARLNGTTTVTIPYDANLTAVDSGPAVRMLHFTGSSWEDVTATPPADGHFVTGTLSTLGPVVAAVKSQ